ncbi:CoA transferase [Nocardioides sp. B-3]|nr:CoA transferase [Nocardioides sp. B-3]UUZ59514.1 CoA transferase [Nocardioides sp. B-3]
MMEDPAVGAATNGVAKQRMGNQQANICPNGLFPTADGDHVIIPASTPVCGNDSSPSSATTIYAHTRRTPCA